MRSDNVLIEPNLKNARVFSSGMGESASWSWERLSGQEDRMMRETNFEWQFFGSEGALKKGSVAN